MRGRVAVSDPNLMPRNSMPAGRIACPTATWLPSTNSPLLSATCSVPAAPTRHGGCAEARRWRSAPRRRCVRGLRLPARLGLEAQRGQRHFQHVVLLLDHDLRPGRSFRQQRAVEIGGRQDDRIGHHVLLVLRRLAHLPHRRLEAAVGIGIHREVSALAGRDAPISASSTRAWISMSSRRWATTKVVRDSRPTASVWPSLTNLPTTTPSIGERITVRSRSAWAAARTAAFSGTAIRGLFQLGLDPADVGAGAVHREGVEGHQ